MQDPLCGGMIVFADHETSGKDSDATFEHAHVYVHLKASYILPLEKGGGKGNDRWICAAQKFLHIRDVEAQKLDVEPSETQSRVARR